MSSPSIPGDPFTWVANLEQLGEALILLLFGLFGFHLILQEDPNSIVDFPWEVVLVIILAMVFTKAISLGIKAAENVVKSRLNNFSLNKPHRSNQKDKNK